MLLSCGSLNELSLPLFPPELFTVFFLICSSNRHQLMLKHWTSEPYKRPSWFIDKTPGRVFLASLLLKDTTVIPTETMTSPRVLSIKHLRVNKNNNKKVCFKQDNKQHCNPICEKEEQHIVFICGAQHPALGGFDNAKQRAHTLTKTEGLIQAGC